MVKRFRKVAVGGTFDRLHKGHIRLIEKALEMGSSVILGLTTDEMLKSYPKKHDVTIFSERLRDLLNYLTRLGVISRVRVVPLNDLYGPTIVDREIEALIVSAETSSRGDEINEIRRKKGFQPMRIIIVDTVMADDGLPISTSRIRKSEIDREGHLIVQEVKK